MRIFLAVVAAAVVSAGEALACSCSGSTREEAFRSADLVFDGALERIEVKRGDQDRLSGDLLYHPSDLSEDPEPVGRLAIFSVERELKGVGAQTREIAYNIETGGNCGMSFEAGKRYRVFAYGGDGAFSTGTCSSTAELLLAPDEVNQRAVDDAERYAKANPDDRIAQWRPERIRSEIDDEYFYRAYLKSTRIRDGADLLWMKLAFAAALDMNDVERADAISEKALAAFAEEPDAQLMRATALRERARFDEALTAAERALALDPGSLEARDETERLRMVVKGEATPGRRDYRRLFAKKIDARNCVAPDADFSDSAFVEADFSGAIFDGARFRRVIAEKITFDGARLKGARFDRAGGYHHWAEGRVDTDFAASFAGADLRGASFAGTMFSAGDFTRADLRDANFSDASIRDAAFSGARLSGARFTGAEFYSTRVDGADLARADFSGAKALNVSWRGADLSRAMLTGADLRGGVIDCATKLPKGFAVKGSGLIPEKAQCGREKQNRDFSGLKWPNYFYPEGMALDGANFSRGEFGNSWFRNAKLAQADFSGAAGEATFAGADLTGASFRGATIDASFGAAFDQLKGVRYEDAVLRGADFSRATLDARNFLSDIYDGARFSIDLSTAKFDGARMTCSAPGFEEELVRVRAAQSSNANSPDSLRPNALKRRRAFLEAFLAAEAPLVRQLSARWPTMTFDETCDLHFKLTNAE